MTDVLFTACDLHFPHKTWTTNPRERQNYLAIERWAAHYRKSCAGISGPVLPSAMTETEVGITGCDLHIPHKDWSGDERERQNYLAMERWANFFRKYCCAGASGGLGPPPSPPILVVGLSTHTYCTAGLGAPPAVEDDIRYSGISLITPGITYDSPLGSAVTVQPFTYTSDYYGDPVHWFMPPATNVRISLQFGFTEPSSAFNTELVSRSIRVWIVRTSDNFVYGSMSNTATGARLGPIIVSLTMGPFDFPAPWTIHSYCLWGSVRTPGFGAQQGGTPIDAFTVTGDIT